jgi:hypothetical protein
MFFALVAQIVSFLLGVLALPCRSAQDKDLEILLLLSWPTRTSA